MATKNKYINAELDWAEEKLIEWKEYMDANPIHTLQDRTEVEESMRGTRIKVIASIEVQGKYIQEMMKNYLSLLAVVDNLREIEEKKKEARGRQTVPHRMK